jgi:hypothetical protein
MSNEIIVLLLRFGANTSPRLIGFYWTQKFVNNRLKIANNGLILWLCAKELKFLLCFTEKEKLKSPG